MVNLKNFGRPSVINIAFVPLAIEAGIEATIRSLVPLATDDKSLLIALKDALEPSNPTLAEALRPDTLGLLVRYIAQKDAGSVASLNDVPETLNADGPAATFAGRTGDTISVTWTGPPADHTSLILLDGVIVHHSAAQDDGDGTADDSFVYAGLSNDAHTIRVLYKRTEDGAITRLGPVATIDAV